MADCYVCGTPIESLTRSTEFFDAQCLRCGNYRISIAAENAIEPGIFTQEEAANASGYIRENQGLLIDDKELAALKLLRTPTVGEKAIKALVGLAHMHPIPGDVFAYNPNFAAERVLLLKAAVADGKSVTEACDDEVRKLLALQSWCWAVSFSELKYFLDVYFPREGLVHNDPMGPRQLMPKGWAAVDEARRGTIPSDKAFVAMAFREWLRPLYDDGIAVGIRNSGYEPIRIDRVQHNNRIDDEIIATIRRCKFVVSDFTLNRGGIYFDAGFGMGRGRPVIWTARNSCLRRVHFDTRQYNFIEWSFENLPGFAQALQNRIEATIGRGPL